MFKTSMILFSLTTSILSHAAMSDFPIIIDCQDKAENPNVQVKMGLSPLKNEAQLYYKTDEMAEPVIFGTGNSMGYHSSANVKIESSLADSLHGLQDLAISAHMGINTRVSTYAQFSLKLEQNAEGNFIAKRLSYAQGIDAFPDTQIEGNVQFEGLNCLVRGL